MKTVMTKSHFLTLIALASLVVLLPSSYAKESELDNDPPYMEVDCDTAGGPCSAENEVFAELNLFAKTSNRAAERVLTSDSYKFFKKFREQGVPEGPLRLALDYFEKNKAKFPNQNFISIADYSQNSRNKRFYMLDMRTGKVLKEQVSHGSGKVNGVNHGDPNHDGMLDRCVHTNGSTRNMTRPGFFKTANPYRSSQSFPLVGKHKNNSYNGLRLIGLEDRNKDALDSGVVMHEANYNRKGNTMGRSFGCPAFAPGVAKNIFPNIMEGSLFYAHAPQCN